MEGTTSATTHGSPAPVRAAAHSRNCWDEAATRVASAAMTALRLASLLAGALAVLVARLGPRRPQPPAVKATPVRDVAAAQDGRRQPEGLRCSR